MKCICPECDEEIDPYKIMCEDCMTNHDCLLITVFRLSDELDRTKLKLKDANGSFNLAIGAILLLAVGLGVMALKNIFGG